MKKGQTLFELVIAIGVALLILTGIVHIVTTSIRNSTFAKNQSEATRYAQEMLEWLRKERDSGWDELLENAQLSPNEFGYAVQTFCFEQESLSWPDPPLACNIQSDNDKMAADSRFWREVVIEWTGDLDDPEEDIIHARVKLTWRDSAGVHDSTIATRLTNWRTAQ